MSRAAQPQLFSFSFLDILACTVGAILFVLMVQALQLAEVAPLPMGELQGLRADVAALKSESAARSAELARDEAALATSETELADLQAKLKAERERVRKARRRLPRKRVKDLAPLRPRVSRATNKAQGLVVDCRPDAVEVVKLEVKPGEREGIQTVVLTPVASAKPDRLSALSKRLEALDPDRQFVFVLLRPKSVKAFRKLRSALKKLGLEIGWKPLNGLDRTFHVQGGGSGGARTD